MQTQLVTQVPKLYHCSALSASDMSESLPSSDNLTCATHRLVASQRRTRNIRCLVCGRHRDRRHSEFLHAPHYELFNSRIFTNFTNYFWPIARIGDLWQHAVLSSPNGKPAAMACFAVVRLSSLSKAAPFDQKQFTDRI